MWLYVVTAESVKIRLKKKYFLLDQHDKEMQKYLERHNTEQKNHPE